MRRLVEELGSLARASGEPVTVVLDGRPFDLDGNGVEVRFASRRGRDAADDDIAALVAADAAPGDLRWSPRTPRSSGAFARHGAGVEGAGAFRRRLDGLAAVADPRYRTAFLDWLACAARGRTSARRGPRPRTGDAVAAAATAGHVLDFDDTYLPGIAHLSAPTAPAALAARRDTWGRCSTPTPPASRRWARWRARATRRSTTAASTRRRCAAGWAPP